MEDLTTYEAIFDESTKGVFGISLVENPATQEYFITLSEEEKKQHIKLSTIDLEKRLLLGLVLEPNVPIYRNQDGEEFNIVFNAETITSLAHGFISNGYQLSSSIEHEDSIKDIAFVESWIVDDTNKDKSNAYGLKYPKGSWVVAMKVNSESVWNDYVKTGKVKGFSIDAVVKLKKINNQNKVKMSLSEKLKNFIGIKTEEIEVKLGEVMLEGGDVIFEYEGEMPEVGGAVFAIDKTDPTNKIPVPVGKYPLEDGSTLVVNEEGIIGGIVPIDSGAAAPEAAPAPAPVAAEKEAVPLSDVSETVNDIKSILIKYEENFAKLDALQKKVDAMSLEFAKVKEEVVQFSEQPSRKPVTSMAAIPLDKKGRLLEKLRNN